MSGEISDSSRQIECDVIVAGSGAGGLAAAVVAASRRLSVVLIEKEPLIGGTTSVSGGGLWVPANSFAEEAGISDDLDEAKLYLKDQLGSAFPSETLDAYLEAASAALEFFTKSTALRLFLSAGPDHDVEAPGAKAKGRSLSTVPFDARCLGAAMRLVRPPEREQRLWGMGIALAEKEHFFNVFKSWRSAAFVIRKLALHVFHLMRYGQSVRWVNGHALVGRLLKSAIDAGVSIRTSARLVGLDYKGNGVREAQVLEKGAMRTYIARYGVVLACGGFPHDRQRQSKLFAHVRAGAEHQSPSPVGNTGDGLLIGESCKGFIDPAIRHSAYWSPVSRVPRPGGEYGIFMNGALDRAKPGFIAINGQGMRFVNEATDYHRFVEAMFNDAKPGEPSRTYLICDHRAIRRYGLGAARPAPLPLHPHIRSGYIVRAADLRTLAAEIGVDAHALSETVLTFNQNVADGRDPSFHKGASYYDRHFGDPTQFPNPCLAPLNKPPFYALRLFPGDVGTFAGLKTDRFARVLQADGRPIAGLFAVGADMANPFAGYSPGGGITLGPALVFGYIAGNTIANQVALDSK